MILSSVPLQKVDLASLRSKEVELYVYRLDQNHMDISGNKPFKLEYNILEAKKRNQDTLLTFGGAFSNHIAATAAAGKEMQMKTIGIIRGEEYADLNPTLSFARSCGMELHYVSRSLYQNKLDLYAYVDLHFVERNVYLIPEGGANDLGVKGCMEITKGIAQSFDIICCPCGTGTTLAGIILSLQDKQQAIGFQVLKSENYIHREVENWLRHFGSSKTNWIVNEEYHFGGYAKVAPDLKNFIENFETDTGIPLDPVYTGKMMYGITDMIEKGLIKKGQTVVAVHTGGLQGNAGFKN